MKSYIRKSVMADIPRLREIRANVRENILSDPGKVTEADYRWFIQNGPLWVWDDEGIIKGLAAGDPRDGTIWALFVDPPYERQGIGRALFARACQSMNEAGHHTLTLYTGIGTRAERFYRAAGWQEIGVSADGDVTLRITTKPIAD
jgi:GNAT superfamily N-acetyltransferase